MTKGLCTCIWGKAIVKVYSLAGATPAFVTNKMTNNKKHICNIETQKIFQSMVVTKTGRQKEVHVGFSIKNPPGIITHLGKAISRKQM